MNWIKSLFFLIISFSVYYLMGDFLLKQVKTKIDNVGAKIIVGFLTIYFLSFLVGFPCQALHLSWAVYKYVLIFVYCLTFLFVFLMSKSHLINGFKKFKKDISKNIIVCLRNNWVLFAILIIFSVLSSTNSLQLLGVNYDDGYYVGKVVHLIGIDKIGVENYFNGSLNTSMSIDISRIFNTCDLTYAFFADVFSISPVFFLRMTIMLEHYALILISYKMFATLFVKKEYAQYALLPLLIISISAGMMSESPKLVFHVGMYDNWQNQSAIYYGSSIVRCMILPTILYFSSYLLKKTDIRMLILIVITSITFMSFSTIALQPLLLFGGVLIIIKIILLINEKIPNLTLKHLIFLISALIMIILLYKFSFKSFNHISSYTSFCNDYMPWKHSIFSKDILLFLAPFVLTAMVFIAKEKNKYVILTLEIVFLIFYVDIFINILAFSSVFMYFVALRTLTEIQLMVCICIGVLAVALISRIKTNYTKQVLAFVSIISLILVPYNVNDYYHEIKSFNYLSSGMTKSGYRLNQITQNDQMMEDEYVVIGKYFNNLKYGNYSLLVPGTISKGKEKVNMTGINIASNRIQTFDYLGNGMSDKELGRLRDYLDGKEEYSNISDALVKYKITYIMVVKEKVKEDLIHNGYKSVLTYSKKSKFSLLKKEY